MRVVHYLNQFFGGLGGEDKAGTPLEAREGAVGPGLLLEQLLGNAMQKLSSPSFAAITMPSKSRRR